jgi:hypothetical protein
VVQLGGALRLAAFVFHREAVKARRAWGGGGGRGTGAGPKRRRQARRRLCEVRQHGHPPPPYPPPSPDTGPSPPLWAQRGVNLLILTSFFEKNRLFYGYGNWAYGEWICQ